MNWELQPNLSFTVENVNILVGNHKFKKSAATITIVLLKKMGLKFPNFKFNISYKIAFIFF